MEYMKYLLVFFYFFSLIWVIVTGILSYIFGYLPTKKKDRCTMKTLGTVIGPSNLRYDDIRIPLVEYFVNGIRYTRRGPNFKYVIRKNSTGIFNRKEVEYESNLNSRDDLPEVLRLNSSSNSFIKVSESPLMKLFPVGSEVDVFYNPDKPKESYVHRYIEPPRIFRYIIYGIFILTIITNISILISLIIF